MQKPLSNKHRVALVGTGHRGTGMWGKELFEGWRDEVEFVALCDTNPLRLAEAGRTIGAAAPLYTDFDGMIREVRPQTLIDPAPKTFSRPEEIWIPHTAGGHHGGDDRLRDMLFKSGTEDPLGQRAGARGGALSLLTGVAAWTSAKEGRPVTIRELMDI